MTSVPHSGAKSVTPGGSVAGGAVKERPILFSGPMVRALLDGRKTQTRRVVKNVPSWDHFGRDIMDWSLSGIHQGDFEEMAGSDRWFLDVQTDVDDHSRDEIRCPYGAVGDRLYVREAWKPHSTFASIKPRDIPESKIFYRADGGYAPSNTPWKPGIHMPRWMSRLVLEITDVRVERLNDCSEADAMAEGTQEPSLVPIIGACWSERDAYAKLWEHINGAGSWAANPWVWAVSFRVLDQEAIAKATAGETRNAEPIHRRDGDEG